MARNMDLQQVRGLKGRNLLHIASATGQLDLCRFLVEELGFDANSTSAEGNPPHLDLWVLCTRAAQRRRLALALTLRLTTYADSLTGETAIVVANEAVRDAVVPVLSYLLSRGGDPTAPDAMGRTPLHGAAEHGAFFLLARFAGPPVSSSCCVWFGVLDRVLFISFSLCLQGTTRL
jgi:ankyrin repeat protein